MGAGISGIASDRDTECVSPRWSTKLGDVPESCISLILASLDPPEICKLARVNRAFHAASLADFVWESKLPSNYRFLVRRVLGEDPDLLSKKEVYSRLCQASCFDDGNEVFWLDKISGDICLCISSKALKITGIDDRRYWNYIATNESRFSTVAYLQQIWWVEVVGEIEFQFVPGQYSLFFRLQLGKSSRKFGRRVSNLDQVHGWNIKPVRFQLSTSNGHRATSECYLYNPGNWVDYHVGDFYIDNPSTPVRIKFSMVQIDCTHTKGGLCVDSVLICPTGFKKRLKLP
ncbi:F-box protein PP2-A13 [Eucalyptus grandis]|uniref:F-box protein PP2-A13 n=1 Tax=Eucalyptus grandis TaxID=71139 RepID=UPI00192E9B11|nr:F-box protein PP2-A13 [Eucalyptus grandis]